MTPDEAEFLLDLSEVAIRARLDGARYPGPDMAKLPPALRRPCSTFVTLHVDHRLNGCIGNIGGHEPIGTCVGNLAVQAAFEDPRLPQLRRQDLDHLHIEVSILSELQVVPAATRAELLEGLEPRRHGLVIASGRHRAVFLPSVWDEIGDPDQFVDRLLMKARLSVTEWPDDMRAEVFTTSNVGRDIH